MRHDKRLQIRLLGPLEVIMTGRPIVVDTRKALAIVALVAADGRPFARDELAAMFWPDADDEAARGALRRTLSALRTAVGDVGIAIERSRVSLDPDSVSIDLAEVERLARSASLADLERASVLARGPFLAGFALRDSPAFDDWQATRAIGVERLTADLLDRLADARLAAGDGAGAVHAARRRVDLDPLDESGQRRLIELFARSGERGAAIRQYRSLVAVFDRELGVTPLHETTELYEAIRDDRLPRPAPAGSAVKTMAALPRVEEGVARRPAVLIGRDSERDALIAAWQAARPDGRIVAIEGEAGIGKTRLGDALVDAARSQGSVTLAARAFPGETGIAYGPIVELLRSGLSTPGGIDRMRALGDATRREIGRMIDLPTHLRVPGHTTADGASARIRLLAAIADALIGLVAGPVPGVLWLDDVHLADDPTREALGYIAHRLKGRSVLVLVAWRREDLSPAGLSAADDLARTPGAGVVRLGRLDPVAMAGIVRAAGRATLDARAVDAIVADSEGLPLHAVEAVLATDPSAAGSGSGVHALLLERIGSVSQTAAQVLAAASVIGRSFDLPTVRHASGRSDEETVDAVEELLRRGLVRELPSGPTDAIRYDFSHGRLRDVAYESTSLARRRLLHARTADALRLDLGRTGADDPTRFARIAMHEREAGHPVQASAAFRDAADRAQAVFANREAIEHLEAALALGDPEAGPIHARIGELRARLGEYPSAIASLETAAALADASALAALEVALGRVHRRRGDLSAAASHLDAALATPGTDPATRVSALVERSVVALRSGESAMAASMADAARDLARTLRDGHGVGVVERLVGLVAQARGDLVGARVALERSVSLAADDPDPTAAIAARTALALAQAADGAIDEAVVTATQAVEDCRRIGDRHLEAAVENHLADLLHTAGRVDDSMVHLKRAVTIFAEIGEGASEPDPGIWSLSAW